MSDTDLSEIEEDEFEVEPKPVKVKLPTEEEKCMTKEEMEEREAKRLTMSNCCVEEAWKLYRELTGAAPTAHVAHTDTPSNASTTAPTVAPGNVPGNVPANVPADVPDNLRPLSVLYDPEMDKRRIYLEKKYHYMLQGFHQIKEAPSKPYIRPQPPRDMNVAGRHNWQPCIIRVQMPEVDTDYSKPFQVSAKTVGLKVYNKSFEEDLVFKDSETQTWRSDVQGKCRRWCSKKRWSSAKVATDVPNEGFELEDYPIDVDGNPVGKSTGTCEWCHGEILPWPTQRQLRDIWNFSRLFCCTRYQQLYQEVENFEQVTKAELDFKNCFIDIKPKPRYKRPSSHASSRQSSKPTKDPTSITSLKTSMVSASPAISKQRQMSDKITKINRMAKLKKILENKLKELANPGKEERYVDTFDLPWDPYETRFGHPKLFNDQLFDDAELHEYNHQDIYESQSGCYDNVAHPDKQWTGNDLSTLISDKSGSSKNTGNPAKTTNSLTKAGSLTKTSKSSVGSRNSRRSLDKGTSSQKELKAKTSKISTAYSSQDL